MGFNYLKAAESLGERSLLITTKFPQIPGTHLINLRKMKGLFDLYSSGLNLRPAVTL